MNMNLVPFLLGKTVASDLGEERSTQLGLIAGLMPGMQGVIVAALIARREEPVAPKPADPAEVRRVGEALRDLLARLTPKPQ